MPARLLITHTMLVCSDEDHLRYGTEDWCDSAPVVYTSLVLAQGFCLLKGSFSLEPGAQRHFR